MLSLLRVACSPAIDACIEELPVDVLAPGVDDMGNDIVFEEEALEVVEGLYEELRASSFAEVAVASDSGRGLALSILLLLLVLVVDVVDDGASTF